MPRKRSFSFGSWLPSWERGSRVAWTASPLSWGRWRNRLLIVTNLWSWIFRRHGGEIGHVHLWEKDAGVTGLGRREEEAGRRVPEEKPRDASSLLTSEWVIFIGTAREWIDVVAR